MQKIRWIPTSKFVFRERKAQVFILISLMPTSALSCPLRKPNLLVFIYLKFTLNFLYSNFPSNPNFTEYVLSNSILFIFYIHSYEFLFKITSNHDSSSQVKSVSTHVSDIQHLQQLGHESKIIVHFTCQRFDTIKHHTFIIHYTPLNQYN